ncbi:MAG: transposase [Fimbriimonas sp.]
MGEMKERKHRLPAAAYRGRKTVSFTACVEGRRPLFQDPEVVDAMVGLLAKWSVEAQCLVPIYCFMPDHLHTLIQGTEESSLPKRAMDEFKAGAGLWLARHRPAFSLQKDYHDHLIRSSVDWRRHAFYILNNPVRKGLTEDGYAYPFTGSIGYDLVEMLHEISW